MLVRYATIGSNLYFCASESAVSPFLPYSAAVFAPASTSSCTHLVRVGVR